MPSSHPIGVNLISVSGNMSDLYDIYKGMRIYYHSKGLETMATTVSTPSLNTMSTLCMVSIMVTMSSMDIQPILDTWFTMSTAWSVWSVCTMYIACTSHVMSKWL